MGYLSQVVITFTKEAFNKHVEGSIKDFKDCDQIKQCGETVTFIWESVKWYDDYSDVKSIMSVIKRIEEDDTLEQSYGFLRAGEEVRDIEEQGDPSQFDLYTSTQVNTDYAGEEVEHDDFFAPNSIKFIKEE